MIWGALLKVSLGRKKILVCFRFFSQSLNTSNYITDSKNDYYHPFLSEAGRNLHVTMEGKNILGSKYVKCSMTCFNILGGDFYSLQKKFSFSVQGHTMS